MSQDETPGFRAYVIPGRDNLSPQARPGAWLGRLVLLADGNHSYHVRIVDFDGEYFWAKVAG